MFWLILKLWFQSTPSQCGDGFPCPLLFATSRTCICKVFVSILSWDLFSFFLLMIQFECFSRWTNTPAFCDMFDRFIHFSCRCTSSRSSYLWMDYLFWDCCCRCCFGSEGTFIRSHRCLSLAQSPTFCDPPNLYLIIKPHMYGTICYIRSCIISGRVDGAVTVASSSHRKYVMACFQVNIWKDSFIKHI